jgi:bla regulator protein BlaR1
MIIGVIQHLFISTAFGFAIATVVFLVKGQSAATRYRLWLLAALKFAVPTIVFTSLGNWLHRAWVPERLFADWVVNFPTAPLMGHSDLLLPSGPIVSYETAWATLTGIWCLGACFHLSAWFIRLGRQHRPTMEAPVVGVQMVSALHRRMALRRSVQVRSAMSGGELSLAGIFNSEILLPPGLCEWLHPAELEAVLTHELAHAQRWDNLAAVVVHLLTCVFWFHPGLWWIERRLIVERELACDETVIDRGCSANTYLAGIVKICRLHLVELNPGACGVSGSSLQERMHRIMSYTPAASQARGGRLAIGAMGAIMTLAPFIVGFFKAESLYGQTGRIHEGQTRGAVTCVFADKHYPEGAVIHQAGGPQQLCVESFGKPLWVRTSPKSRERGQSVNEVPTTELPKAQTAAFCLPKASQSKNCAPVRMVRSILPVHS